MLKISVVLVTYNHEDYIAAAIQSILDQSFTDFELIVVNDGSSDDTEKVIQQFSDPRIRYVAQKNQGTSSALNLGISLTTAPLIAFMSGDDISEPNRLAIQYQYKMDKPACKALFSKVSFIDGHGRSIMHGEGERLFNTSRGETRAALLRYFFFYGNFLNAVTCFIEKAVLQEMGLFHLTSLQLQDYDLWVKVVNQYDIVVLPEKLVRYRYRQDNGNVSHSCNDSRLHSENFLILKNLFNATPMNLFKQAFSTELKNPHFSTQIEYELEKSFLYLQHASPLARFIGYERLFSFLQEKEFRIVAEKQYHFGFRELYQLAAACDIAGVNNKISKLVLQRMWRFLKKWSWCRWIRATVC